MAKQWTIMVYMASSANIRGGALETLVKIKEVGSTDYFDVFVQVDSSQQGVPTKRYKVKAFTPDAEKEAKASLEALRKIEPEAMRDTVRNLKNIDIGAVLTNVKSAKGTTLKQFLENIPDSKDVKGKLQDALKKIEAQKIRDNPDLFLDLLKILVLESALKNDKPVTVDALPPEPLVGVNAGDPAVLREFIRWGIKKGKAPRNMVILWGHGDGFSIAGAATLRDLLRPDELAQAFRVKPRVDLVGFNSCMMGMLEVYHELRGLVPIGVGAEGFIPESSWPYEKILGHLKDKHGNLTPEQLATSIVKLYVGSHRAGDLGIDLAACRVSKSRVVATALSHLVEPLRELLWQNHPELRDAIIASRLDVQKYETDYVDLYHFCALLSHNLELLKNSKIMSNKVELRSKNLKKLLPKNPTLDDVRLACQGACQDVMKSIKTDKEGDPTTMVIEGKNAGDDVKHSFGVSIYFPSLEVSRRYRNLKIEGSDWERFLQEYQKSARDLLA